MDYGHAFNKGKKVYNSKVKSVRGILNKKAGLPGKAIPTPSKFPNSIVGVKKTTKKVFTR